MRLGLFCYLPQIIIAMKIFKLTGLDYYVIAANKQQAVSICWLHKIGITSKNIEETSILTKQTEAKLFRSFSELNEAEDEIA